MMDPKDLLLARTPHGKLEDVFESYFYLRASRWRPVRTYDYVDTKRIA